MEIALQFSLNIRNQGYPSRARDFLQSAVTVVLGYIILEYMVLGGKVSQSSLCTWWTWASTTSKTLLGVRGSPLDTVDMGVQHVKNHTLEDLIIDPCLEGDGRN